MKTFRKLRAVDCEAAEKIVRALTSTIKSEISPEEKDWIERIEALRSKLAASSAEIVIDDFGSGAANLRRTKEEMYEGVNTTTTLSRLMRLASKSAPWTLLLFYLVRQFQPSTAIELGTCCGISAAFQASAQKTNRRGRLITLEGDVALVSIARNNMSELGLDNVDIVAGRFQDTLAHVLSACQPVEYVFIDGHHDEHATISYFEACLPFVAQQSTIILDDISWSRGMRRAWNTIVKNPHVKIAVDTGEMGICVLDNTIDTKTVLKVWLIGRVWKATLQHCLSCIFKGRVQFVAPGL